MFTRSPFVCALRESYRIVCCSPTKLKPFLYAKKRVPVPICSVSRYYSKDSNTKGPHWNSGSPEQGAVKDENTNNMIDIEEERNKLSMKKDFSKYTVFKDEDSPIIFDVEEERLFSQSESSTSDTSSPFDGVSLERGVRGVFDVEDLVDILRKKQASDIVVIELPESFGYADQMVIVSGKSARHLLSMSAFVRKLFKMRMSPRDVIPEIEGKAKKNEHWLALDLGNIILHIFSSETRKVYDLESLWTLGPDFDPHLNKIQDPVSDIISKHSLYLGDLEPADTKS